MGISTVVRDDWSEYLLRERHERLRDLALSISVRRTVDEAELGLRLADDFKADPSILQDIDFASLARRLERDIAESNGDLRRAQLLAPKELEDLTTRQRKALTALSKLGPEELATASGDKSARG